jgi:hypothetical protein
VVVLRRTLAAGAVAAGLAPFMTAAPAGAATSGQDSGTASVSFHFNGAPLTCPVAGASAYGFQDENDTTVIDASVGAFGSSACRTALYGVTLFVRYETAPGSGTFATSRVDGLTATEGQPASPGVSTRLEVPGPTGPIEVRHTAQYFCDENPRTATCPASVVTNPK